MLTHRCSVHSDTQAWGWAWSATERAEGAHEGQRKGNTNKWQSKKDKKRSFLNDDFNCGNKQINIYIHNIDILNSISVSLNPLFNFTTQLAFFFLLRTTDLLFTPKL